MVLSDPPLFGESFSHVSPQELKLKIKVDVRVES